MTWWRLPKIYAALTLAGSLPVTAPVNALEPSVLEAARDEASAPDIGQQLITLIGFTALPGISGSNFYIDRNGDQPDYNITKITVGGSYVQSLSELPFDLRLEAGFGYSETDEKAFGFKEIGGSTVAIKTDRRIYSGRAGTGPSFEIFDGFRFAPMFHLAISRFDNEAGIGELLDDETDRSIADLLTLDWSIWALTYAGSLNLHVDRQYQGNRLELEFSYAHAETEVFDAPSSQLEVSGSNDIFTGLVRWTEPTGQQLFGEPLLWNFFATGTILAGDGRNALGFGYFGELGVGLDLDLRERDYAFVEAIRLRASGVFGPNVLGWQVGTGFRF